MFFSKKRKIEKTELPLVQIQKVVQDAISSMPGYTAEINIGGTWVRINKPNPKDEKGKEKFYY